MAFAARSVERVLLLTTTATGMMRAGLWDAAGVAVRAAEPFLQVGG